MSRRNVATAEGRGSALERLFAVDLRSLAAFRIALGVLLLVDLSIRAADLELMYTDDGMFSRTTICRHYSGWNWSFHLASGSASFQKGLFLFAGVLAGSLLVGYQTRLVTVGSWLLLTSVQNRVPHVLSGADNLLRLLVFWGMFLPLGGSWSLDSWSNRRRGIPHTPDARVLSVASAAVLLQMAFMYFFSAVFKSNAAWVGGKAITAALTDGFYGKPVAAGLVGYPHALEVLTVSILVFEWVGPLLLFSPWKTRTLRLCVVGLLAAMHVGIALLLNVGLFSFVSIAGLLNFLPSSLWNRLLPGARSSAQSTARATTPLVSDQPITPGKVAAQALCALALVYVLFANLTSLPSRALPWTPSQRNELFSVSLGLGQKWDMFADAPSRSGWFVASATLADGTQVDLLRQGEKVSWERPSDPSALYPNHRWRKFFIGISYGDLTGFEVFLEPVADALARLWNRSHPAEKQVTQFALVFCSDQRNEAAGVADPGFETKRVTMIYRDYSSTTPARG